MWGSWGRVGRRGVVLVALAAGGCTALTGGDRGVVDGALAACPPAPHCVGSGETVASRQVAPLPLGGDADATWRRLAGIVGAMPRTRIVTQRDDYLHAEVRSAVFGFVDDVEFLRVDAAGKVEVRSASRVGYYDFGVNRDRIETIRQALAAPA
jgi:uncharacterized protein (DUF1499 family)